LAIAQGKAAAAGIGSARFLEQSIEAFEAPAGSFDAACCSFAIVLLAEGQPFLAKMRRLLEPGGFLAFTTNSAESCFNPQMLAAAAGAIRWQLQQAGSLPLREAQRR
jgi:ubiquinone/menaquinone biosynthesis C-methylase UbiE